MLEKYVTDNPQMSDEVKNNTLNIFWGGNFEGVVGGATGSSKSFLYQTSPYFAFYNGWDGPEKVKDNLAHELAHNLGLIYNFIVPADPPNPAENVLIVDIHSINDSAEYTIEVFNISGKELYTNRIEGNAISHLDIAGLPPGILIVKVLASNQQIKVMKIVHI